MLLQTTYVLIIAVENYLDPKSFPKVDYASNDADDLKEVLINNRISQDENITVLKNKKATNAAIRTELDRLTKYVTSNDRIFVFFAGHGAYAGERNFILPTDSYKTDILSTGVSIEYILGILKKAKTNKCILLLDCCHSGFVPGTDERGIDDSFMADELSYKYRGEEYICGFASCKSSQTSISHHSLKNGVWTHYLIKALNGDAKGYYEKGLLFSGALQNYLNKEVSSFVPMNSAKKRKQTPVMFGNISDRFIIADLNNSIEEKRRIVAVEDNTLKEVSLLNLDSGNIKSLSGFIKGSHTTPKTIYSGANDFVQKIGKNEIKDEIDELAPQIKNVLNYKRKDVQADSGDGLGSIVTPDFTYSMELKQSNTNADEYVIIRRLEDFTNSHLVLGGDFNKLFDGLFKKLEFKVSRKIDVEALIDMVEEMEDNDSIEIDYNPSDTSTCTITFREFEYEIFVTSESIAFQTPYSTTPVKLIEAYKGMRAVLIDSGSLNLLS